jgi:hypothetical protein
MTKIPMYPQRKETLSLTLGSGYPNIHLLRKACCTRATFSLDLASVDLASVEGISSPRETRKFWP